MTELQIAMAALGAAVIIAVLGYNKWQERKHRREAERAFRSEHDDVLLPSGPLAGERIEPTARFGNTEDETVTMPEPAPVAEDTAGPSVELPAEPPIELADERIDCVIRFELLDAIPGGQLLLAHAQVLGGLNRPVRWSGLDEAQGEWRLVASHDARPYRRLRAALQLADRCGPVGEEELNLFFSGVQRLAEQLHAVADAPSRSEIQAQAAQIDRFCAAVDAQIGVNIVSRDGHGFVGTKLRGLAEAAGLQLLEDGVFHAMDERGLTLFTLANLEPSPFLPHEMKSLSTRGLTFTLDIPRVAQGAAVFDRMMDWAASLAGSLDGVLVDDNRAPLNDKAVRMIRDSIARFQEQMQSQGVAPGSPLALRLFS